MTRSCPAVLAITPGQSVGRGRGRSRKETTGDDDPLFQWPRRDRDASAATRQEAATRHAVGPGPPRAHSSWAVCSPSICLRAPRNPTAASDHVPKRGSHFTTRQNPVKSRFESECMNTAVAPSSHFLRRLKFPKYTYKSYYYSFYYA